MSLTNFQIETLAKLRLLLTLTAVEVPDMPDPENWEANVLQLLDLLALGITNIQTGAATSLPWSSITEKPTAFPPETHSHQWSQIQNRPSEYPPESHQHGWTDLTGVPASFPPSLHTHPEYEGALTSVAWADITGKPTTFPPDAHSHVVSWADVEGKPANYPPLDHLHLWANISDRPTSWPWADITGKPITFPPDAHSHAVTWASVEGKPTTFPPDAHSHGIDWGDLTGRPANLTGIAGLSASLSSGQTSWFPRRGALAWSALAIGTTGESLIQAASGTEARTAIDAAPAAHTHDWAGITGKPSTFAPSAHTHDWAGITGKPDLGVGQIRGFVLFEVSAAGVITINLGSNIASVVETSTGIYDVTLSSPAPGDGYFVPTANGAPVSSWDCETSAVWVSSTKFTVAHTVSGSFTRPARISAHVLW